MNYESQKKLQLREVIKTYFQDKSSTSYDFYSDLEDELNLATNYHMEQQRKLESAKSLLSMNTVSSSYPYSSISSDIYTTPTCSGCINSFDELKDTLTFSSGVGYWHDQ